MSDRNCEQLIRAPRKAAAVSARVNGADPPAPVIRAQSFTLIGDAAVLVIASVTVMQRPVDLGAFLQAQSQQPPSPPPNYRDAE